MYTIRMSNITAGRIPRELISSAILVALRQTGSTIPHLEIKYSRKYPGDPEQCTYTNNPIWHTKSDIDNQVATMLKLHKSILDPNRTSNDFQSSTAYEINKLQKKKMIISLNTKNRFKIWRLATQSISLDTPVNNKDTPLVGYTTINNYRTPHNDFEDTLRTRFVSIITHGRKDNTYKFALAKAILEHCSDKDAGNIITYDYLADKFLRYYWHQYCKFRIRQDYHTERKPPHVIQAIINTFGENTIGDFEKLKPVDVQKAKKSIQRKVFGSARSKTSIVVPKFQKTMIGRYAEEDKIFYDYDDDKKTIHLKSGVFDFFHRNQSTLTSNVLLEWAKYLEKINDNLPMLIAKIAKNDAQRNSAELSKFRKLFMEYTPHCFYCGDNLEREYTEVDHFIPWSYLFTDSTWNLVLACRRCNQKKSNSLPQTEFRTELICRNEKYCNTISKLATSLDQLNTGRGWPHEINIHYDTCRHYGFSTIHMP